MSRRRRAQMSSFVRSRKERSRAVAEVPLLAHLFVKLFVSGRTRQVSAGECFVCSRQSYTKKKKKRRENYFGDGVERSHRPAKKRLSLVRSSAARRTIKASTSRCLSSVYDPGAAGRCGSFLFATQVKQSRCRVTKRVQCVRSSSSRRPRSEREFRELVDRACRVKIAARARGGRTWSSSSGRRRYARKRRRRPETRA